MCRRVNMVFVSFTTAVIISLISWNQLSAWTVGPQEIVVTLETTRISTRISTPTSREKHGAVLKLCLVFLLQRGQSSRGPIFIIYLLHRQRISLFWSLMKNCRFCHFGCFSSQLASLLHTLLWHNRRDLRRRKFHWPPEIQHLTLLLTLCPHWRNRTRSLRAPLWQESLGSRFQLMLELQHLQPSERRKQLLI